MQVAVRKKRSLYVGGLEEEATEELLHAAFIPFGNVVEVQIPKDFKDNKNRGFGFVEFDNDADAAEAMDNMDGSELLGRVLRVNIAKPITHKLGASKAVWSSDEWFKQNLKEDQDLADAQDDTDSLVPMDAAPDAAAAKAKGLMIS
uniref:RRM domain-containing protein n=1 Tax=Octactis speculum TaxID=3111310 RepID=A0A7S2H1G4_9STRA|mmetsp:Transcript_60277/g.82680  ORF Transcript_60277/g.82680 Transcript_60277/m.82680 type:complete len:146 (+) Transcript_60277:34-471(+)|eukprot:CAMPEP_0185768206 /NCGR_PEP_ID=MMETSP1174-20130828/48204_1 /TAXON_ID=35687 /ORGANISM="Dictyocha speculum, Strain CCMP1381" /LENGTH=145 /DNA_ID=CAMNT_0028452795 /DNA_START=34 /DNA_END=474 /DNA_ORIENTATION=+